MVQCTHCGKDIPYTLNREDKHECDCSMSISSRYRTNKGITKKYKAKIVIEYELERWCESFADIHTDAEFVSATIMNITNELQPEITNLIQSSIKELSIQYVHNEYNTRKTE